jgi:predicted MFS family arabinose efflux permease
VLYGAETQSIVGDQLARVALSVLVFDRTHSASATILTYAATYLPAIFGGALLARVGDRLSRQFVMVGCDIIRAGLFAAMAISGLPIAGIVALLVAAVFLGPAFAASEVSYLAGALEPELFRVGTALRMMSNQAGQVLGFAAGGALVAGLGARTVLLCDAASYLISAAVIAAALPRGGRDGHGASRIEKPAFAGLWREPRVRSLVLLSALAGLFIVPEGLAVPFGNDIGAGTSAIGVMLAAIPLGGAIGAALLMRVRRRRHTVAAAMAVSCGVPLIVSGFTNHWLIAATCWLVSGGLAAYQVETMTATVQLIPDAVRARAIGAASSVLLGAQGAGLLVFAAVARYATPAHSIGAAGAAGSALAVLVVRGPLRHESARHRSSETDRQATSAESESARSPARESTTSMPGSGLTGS